MADYWSLAYVAKSPVHGRGLFAGRRFRTGDVIEVAPILPTLGVAPRGLAEYGFVQTASEPPKWCIALGYVSMMNHSATPNVYVEIDWRVKCALIRASTNIAKDEELCMDYGEEYWREHG